MSKNIVILKSKNELSNLLNLCDGFILGLKDLSVNLPHYFSIGEISEIVSICKQNNKEIFISLNKNIHNNDLELLISSLKILAKLEIDYVIFYDIAIVNLNKDLGLNLNLIWNQEHLVTNYSTINYWKSEGIFGSYLSSELSLEEIFEIKENVSCPIMINVFGFIPMFTSKRPLVKNYLEKFNLEDDSKINYLEKENNIYPIVSDEVTTVYSSKIMNLVLEIPKFRKRNIDYFVFNSFLIENDKMIEILKLFNETTDNNAKTNFDKINMLLDYNIDTGFLYKDTIYKVKKNG